MASPTLPADGAKREASTVFAPGTLLAGKLRVQRECGRGGMGVVLEARDERLGRLVAVKVILGEMTPLSHARFMREAQAIAALRTEHAVEVYEGGVLDDGSPYLVTELLEGETLESLLAKDGVAKVDDAIRYISEAASALQAAHAIGLVHRDVKLANIFLAKRRDREAPTVKVIDFGIVKDTRPTAEALTRTGEGFGSPAYMSPEQVRGESTVDARSDIWSLGVCLFELLTGDLPFEGMTVPKLLMNVLNAPAAHVTTRRPSVPAELDAIVMRCLEKDPARRFASMAELIAALAAIPPAPATSKEQRPALALQLSATQPTPAPTPRRTTPAPLARRDDNHAAFRAILIFGGAVAFVLLSGAVLFVLAWTRRSRHDARLAEVPPPSASIVAVPAPPEASAIADASTEPVPTVSALASQAPPGPKKKLPRVIMGEGDAVVSELTPSIVSTWATCGVDAKCPPESIVRIHLYSSSENLGTLGDRHERRELCVGANSCVLKAAKKLKLTCRADHVPCDRYIDVIY